MFHFPDKELEKLIVRDEDSLELLLRQGKSMIFCGSYAPGDGSRALKAQFAYNKTFRQRDNREVQGGWTVDMRQDYTLSIWPAVFTHIEDAEKIDAVVHVHFDAKYKIDREQGPRLVTRQEMVDLGYGSPSGDAYLIFKLIPLKAGEPLHGLRCDISRLPQYAGARASTRPITVTFEDILVHAVC